MLAVTIFNQLFDPLTLVSRLLILLIAFPIHEFSHAWIADRFGDITPRLDGRLTLNPAVHLDLMGAVILMLSGFGWAKPVMVNPSALRRSSSAAPMWVALAGPFSNLILAVVCAIPFRLSLLSTQVLQAGFLGIFSQVLLGFISINILLLLFNLIPLAPLDGDKIIDFFLPPSLARIWQDIRPYGPMILLLLLFAAPLAGLDIIGWIILPPLRFLTSLLVG